MSLLRDKKKYILYILIFSCISIHTLDYTPSSCLTFQLKQVIFLTLLIYLALDGPFISTNAVSRTFQINHTKGFVSLNHTLGCNAS